MARKKFRAVLALNKGSGDKNKPNGIKKLIQNRHQKNWEKIKQESCFKTLLKLIFFDIL